MARVPELRDAEASESTKEHTSDRAPSLLQALPQGNNNQHTTEPEPTEPEPERITHVIDWLWLFVSERTPGVFTLPLRFAAPDRRRPDAYEF